MALKLQSSMLDMPRALEKVVQMLDAPSTPFSSQLKSPKDLVAQKSEIPAEVYKRRGYTGVLDGTDASSFDSQVGDLLTCRPQKAWDNVQVSDFADESTTSSIAKRQHLADQAAKALVRVKHIQEAAICSDNEASVDNGTNPNETRGIFKWIQNGAQSVDPVPAAFRPAAAQIHSAADLTTFTEQTLIDMAVAAFKARRGGVAKLDGFVGVDLKAKISSFLRYQATVTGYSPTRQVQVDQEERMLGGVIERYVADTCEINFHPTAFNLLNKSTGAETGFTHTSGFIVDMAMHDLGYVRSPRVVELENKGGGKRAIVDSIFMLRCHNPLSSMAVKVGA